MPHHAAQNCHWSDTSNPPENILTQELQENVLYTIPNNSLNRTTQSSDISNALDCVNTVSKTEQCCSSFFVRSIAEWNHLSEEMVYASQTFVKDCPPSVLYTIQDNVFILLLMTQCKIDRTMVTECTVV